MKIFKTFFRSFRLAILFSVFFFLVSLLSFSLIGFVLYLSRPYHLFGERIQPQALQMWAFAVASLVLGTVLSFLFSRILFRPLHDIMRATDRIAEGDYTARVQPRGYGEFQRLGVKFNHMAEELGSVEMLRSDFVNNFSHEFKTPIVSIRGFARALKWDDLTPKERNEYLDIIITESERLADLSANVLSLSRLEKQTFLVRSDCFNLTEQLRLSVALLDSKWSDKAINFSLEGCEEEIYYVGDEKLLQQVWVNLLDNAIKFSPVGGTVSLCLSRSARAVLLSVSDHGQGMDAETQSHIFDKFYQGDSSHTTKGNGLGLSIVRRIVTLHGGTVTVESTPQQGSTFFVSLPVSEREQS